MVLVVARCRVSCPRDRATPGRMRRIDARGPRLPGSKEKVLSARHAALGRAQGAVRRAPVIADSAVAVQVQGPRGDLYRAAADGDQASIDACLVGGDVDDGRDGGVGDIHGAAFQGGFGGGLGDNEFRHRVTALECCPPRFFRKVMVSSGGAPESTCAICDRRGAGGDLLGIRRDDVALARRPHNRWWYPRRAGSRGRPAARIDSRAAGAVMSAVSGPLSAASAALLTAT